MARKYSLVVDGDEVNGYSAYVPELLAILVVADRLAKLELRAAEAIHLYLETTGLDVTASSTRCEIKVEVPV